MLNKLTKKRGFVPFFGKCSCSGGGAALALEQEEVTVLDYSHNNLVFVPEEVIVYELSLEELFLDSNRLTELPRWLFQCYGLRTLSLNDNEFQHLSSAISNLINLERLDISKNGIQELPEKIRFCKRLVYIEASVNPIGKLPEGLMMLINLRELYLNDTFLEYLPGSFGKLGMLRILELRENRLKDLPKSMCQLVELERLDIGNNHFDIFPETIVTLFNLVELWMDTNKIEYLPKEISNLKKLTFLDLSKNQLKCLPDEIGECTNLSDLYLSENKLRILPESIGLLKNITILKLDANMIRFLPPSIGNLHLLNELILNGNNLTELPNTIGLLKNLRTLNLDENKIKSLPADIGSCTSITILSARGNLLVDIPEEIGRISRLRVLNLSSNRLRFLPYTISKLKELQALWLAENQTKPLMPLQQEKDKYGKRYLTCYLFPQDLISDSFDQNSNNNKSTHKPKSNSYRINSNGNTVVSSTNNNYYDQNNSYKANGHIHYDDDCLNERLLANESNDNRRNLIQRNFQGLSTFNSNPKQVNQSNEHHNHHKHNMIRFVCDNEHDNDDHDDSLNYPLKFNAEKSLESISSFLSSQSKGTDKENCPIRSPYPKEMKNPVHHIRNQAIYESSNKLPPHLTGSSSSNSSSSTSSPQSYPINSTGLNSILANNSNNNGNSANSPLNVRHLTNTVNFTTNEDTINHLNEDSNIYGSRRNQRYQPIGQNSKLLANNSQNQNVKINHPQLISKIHMEKVNEILSINARQTKLIVNDETYSLSNENESMASNSTRSTNYLNLINVSKDNESILYDKSAVKSLNNNDIDCLDLSSSNLTNQTNRLSSSVDSASMIPPLAKPVKENIAVNKKSPLFQTSFQNQSNTNGGQNSETSNLIESSDDTYFNELDSLSTKYSNNVNNNHNHSNINHHSQPLNGALIKKTEASTSQVSSDSGFSNNSLNNSIILNSNKQLQLSKQSTIDETNGKQLPCKAENQNSYELLNVEINKNPGLGFSIAGGLGTHGNPFKPNDKGIFITRVQPDGPAANLVRMGDKILNANGYEFNYIEHSKAVEILKSCNPTARLQIQRFK